MNLRLAGTSGAVLLLLVLAGPVSAFRFVFDCPEDRYLSVVPGQTHQFGSPIQAVAPGNHRVAVTFRPHLPAGWSAHWGLRSTGMTYTSDAQLDLVADVLDRLDVDVTSIWGETGYGWIDLTVRSTEDPAEVAYCTYTLYAGLPVPEVNWDIDCTSSTLYVQDPWAYFEIHNPLVNRLSVPDTLLVEMVYDLPPLWGMHFHHHGVCFPDHAELPLHPLGAPDSMVIMGGISDVAGMGIGEMMLQSKRNPSLAKYCHYRVIYNSPAGIPGPTAALSTAATRVTPNPSAGETVFSLRQAAQPPGTLSIFGADGRLVRSFPQIAIADGNRSIRWDGRDQQGVIVSPGIYFYRFGSGPAMSRGTIVRSR
jgi:hypothetical protein